MCNPARIKFKAAGIEGSADRARGYVEACDLGITREEKIFILRNLSFKRLTTIEKLDPHRNHASC